MIKIKVHQQGEVAVYSISDMPPSIEITSVDRNAKGAFIVSHSENGNHHVIEGGDVMERTNNVPAGMRVLYAIIDNPTALIQDAPGAHKAFNLKPGKYEFRISREHDPFTEQARIVSD